MKTVFQLRKLTKLTKTTFQKITFKKSALAKRLGTKKQRRTKIFTSALRQLEQVCENEGVSKERAINVVRRAYKAQDD